MKIFDGLLVFVDTAGKRVFKSPEPTAHDVTSCWGQQSSRREERGKRDSRSSNDRISRKLGEHRAGLMEVGRRWADRNK